MLSDSTLSFNTIHDRTKRCETAFLNDGTWLADRLAAEAGLDIEPGSFAHGLWEAATSAFSLERWVAERKFGPHFVVAKTPNCQYPFDDVFRRGSGGPPRGPLADAPCRGSWLHRRNLMVPTVDIETAIRRSTKR
jgi:hypothetical protein